MHCLGLGYVFWPNQHDNGHNDGDDNNDNGPNNASKCVVWALGMFFGPNDAFNMSFGPTISFFFVYRYFLGPNDAQNASFGPMIFFLCI